MLRDLTDRNAVISAMREFDKGRRTFLRKYGYRTATEYLVENDGIFYDSKAIAGAAYGYQYPSRGALNPKEFGGGEATVKKKLVELGFAVSRISDVERRNHFLLKLNARDLPSERRPTDWEAREFIIEPVRLTRDGQKIEPRPPSLTPWSHVFIWVNEESDQGGIVAIATIDDVSNAGARCRLRDVSAADRFGLVDLADGTTKETRDLYRDIDKNRRSKVRYLPRAVWESLESLMADYRRKDVLGPYRTFTGVMALTLNQQARGHRIGNLQAIRSQIHNIRQVGKTIFSAKSVKETYAFHSGGREELQFNIGMEGKERFRWGVAFSFEPSRSFPNPEVLARKVRYFNDYIALYGADYGDMSMWKYEDDMGPTDMGLPQPIPPSLVRNHVFIFLGKHDSGGSIDYDHVLDDFDRLLPLYEYVESRAEIVPESIIKRPFKFRPGHRSKTKNAHASLVARELEIDLRHEVLQRALYAQLVAQYGRRNVGTEQICASGKRIDAVVKHGRSYWIYEIKTSSSARACIREAIGQLLEYHLWPGGIASQKLIIVGEMPADEETNEYLAALNTKLSIPTEYLSMPLPK